MKLCGLKDFHHNYSAVCMLEARKLPETNWCGCVLIELFTKTSGQLGLTWVTGCQSLPYNIVGIIPFYGG